MRDRWLWILHSSTTVSFLRAFRSRIKQFPSGRQSTCKSYFLWTRATSLWMVGTFYCRFIIIYYDKAATTDDRRMMLRGSTQNKIFFTLYVRCLSMSTMMGIIITVISLVVGHFQHTMLLRSNFYKFNIHKKMISRKPHRWPVINIKMMAWQVEMMMDAQLMNERCCRGHLPSND